MTGPPLRSGPVADATGLLGVPLVGLTISPIGSPKARRRTRIGDDIRQRKHKSAQETDRARTGLGIRPVLERVIIERLRRGPGETLQHRTAYYQ